MIWPNQQMQPLVTITPFSIESIGDAIVAAATSGQLNASVSATFPAANRAIYVPFFLNMPITVVKLFCVNGATATGNIDMGIYNTDGVRILSAANDLGAIAQSGTNALQTFDVTDRQIGPGVYYLSIGFTSASGTLFRVQSGSVPKCQSLGMAQMASGVSSNVLVASATLATISSDFIPVCGLTTRSVV